MAHRWSKEARAKLGATIRRINAEKKAAREREKQQHRSFLGHSKKGREIVARKKRKLSRQGSAEHTRITRLRHLTAELLRMLPDDKLIDMVRE